MVYEVTVDDVLTDDYTTSDNVITLGSAPGSGSVVLVIYEDESCALQMIQVKSSGVTDPFSQSPVDDAESAYIGIGGHADVSGEAVGTGDNATVIFALDNPCIIEDHLRYRWTDQRSRITPWTRSAGKSNSTRRLATRWQ
jgi:hypothetical protein